MWKKYKKTLQFPESYVSMGLGLLVILVSGMLIYNFIRSKPVSDSGQDQVSNNGTASLAPQPVFAVPTIHVVAPGEDLWVIAEKYYRSGYNWTTIAKANNLPDPNIISTGQKLNIPKADTITVASEQSISPKQTDTSAPEKIVGKTYTVVRGDDLWLISVRAYGDGYQWVKIARANKLVNPNLIHVGNVLTLP